MFADTDSAGDPIDLEYAEMRSRFEPLVEMMQIKGNSEVHRGSGPRTSSPTSRMPIPSVTTAIATYKKYGKKNWVRYGVTKGLAYEKVAWCQSLPLRLRWRHG